MLQDEFYIKHIAEKQVLGPVLDVLLRTMPRDNLLCSACLDLFELIKKENIKDLVKHLVENYREKIAALAYMDTFAEILNRYDQTQGFTRNVDAYFLEAGDDVGRRVPMNANARAMMEAMDRDEQEEWITSGDDEDLGTGPDQATLPGGGSPTGTKPLVDYASDEEAEENGDTVMMPSLPEGDNQNDAQDAPSRARDLAAATPPPERVTEKRRREQDDDDELDKLMQHKRRSSSSASSTAAAAAATLRKKKSFANNSHDQGTNGSKKISISISPSLKNATAGHSPPSDEGAS